MLRKEVVKKTRNDEVEQIRNEEEEMTDEEITE